MRVAFRPCPWPAGLGVKSSFMENNRVYYGLKVYHQISRLHRTLNTGWNRHDDCACAPVKTPNILFLNFCTASSIWRPVYHSKMLICNEMNSTTIYAAYNSLNTQRLDPDIAIRNILTPTN